MGSYVSGYSEYSSSKYPDPGGALTMLRLLDGRKKINCLRRIDADGTKASEIATVTQSAPDTATAVVLRLIDDGK